MSDETALVRRPEDFPPEVHSSLAQLRTLSKSVKSLQEWRSVGRKATPDELALSELLRAPGTCNGHSSRTGLPCELFPKQGAAVCMKHGGNIQRVKDAAERRLLKASKIAVDQMIAFAKDNDSKVRSAAQKAAADILDRNGIGALVQAKVAASKADKSAGVTVTIGFIDPDGTQTAVKVEA